ncbi:MAG: hypothetical protein SGI74_03290 [Oligoflexia bacterium]|nr:hypothetical protein [Oligoflexia bacterium]
MIQGVSFDDCAGIFDQLAIEGRRLTPIQEERLFQQHKRFAPHFTDTREDFIKRLYQSFDVVVA